MNIYKIIFKVNNENLEIKKSFYYRYETKYFGKVLLFQKDIKDSTANIRLILKMV